MDTSFYFDSEKKMDNLNSQGWFERKKSRCEALVELGVSSAKSFPSGSHSGHESILSHGLLCLL